MLPKKFRLTVSEFNLIPQKPINVNGNLLAIKIKKVKNDYPKFAVIVPKSLDKRSTARHKTQRIIMRAIGNKLANIKKPLNIFIWAKKTLDKRDLIRAEKELENLLSKSHLL